MVDLMFTVVEPSVRVPPTGPTLLRSANLVPEGDARWERGLRYLPEQCGVDTIAKSAGDCDNGFSGFAPATAFPSTVDYRPPFVAVATECSAIGGQAAIDLVKERLARLLTLSETAGIARELWRGEVARAASPDLPNDFLSNVATMDDLGNGEDFNVLDALAALEDGLRKCSVGGGNTIHASAQLTTYWAYQHVIERLPDGRLVTMLGTLVISDPGYDGAGPGGAAPDSTGASSWAYGTGPVDVRRGNVEYLADRNQIRARNDFTVYGYRPFAATFDPCCHVGVKVDHTTLT